MLITILSMSLITVETAGPKLEFQGPPGIKVFGYCVTTEENKKSFDAVTPSEVQLDLSATRCQIHSEKPNSGVKLRLFQNRKLLEERSLANGFSGVELVIPLGPSKKK